MLPIVSVPRRFPSLAKRSKVSSGLSVLSCRRLSAGVSPSGGTGNAPPLRAPGGAAPKPSIPRGRNWASLAATQQSGFTDEQLAEVARIISPAPKSPVSTGRTPLLAVDNPEAKREEIRQYFHATFDKTEQLFDLLQEEAFYMKSEPLRHPPIFYYGHTACFFINKLVLAKRTERINPKIEHTCAVGVDEMSWDDLNDAHYDWPTVTEVQAYRDQVRERVDDIISELPVPSLINWDSCWWPIIMGIEHENIHLETSSAIFRQVPLDLIRPSNDFPVCTVDNPVVENELLTVPATTVVYDKKTEDGRVYGWDNEYGSKVAEVPEFRASKFVVSNAEYYEFVQDGGYETEKWWTAEGWTWASYAEAKHPKYWRTDEKTDDWMLRCLTEEVAMPWSWPVVVNQLESKAFCNWKSAQLGKSIRLPSEDEWYALRRQGRFANVDQPDWEVAPGNINLEHFASECPVDMFEWGGTGFHDVVGNVWQWTESPIDALPGFEVHPLYDDFSTPTFDGKHTLFKGGSWISLGCNGATAESRYSFRRHFFQHAGLRYVESDVEVDTKMNLYETDPVVLKEIDTQYATQSLLPGLETFQARLAAEVSQAANKLGKSTTRLLDLGCSVGRSTFEHAKYFDECVGLDQSARFIRSAVQLQDDGMLRYTVPVEGSINTFHETSLEQHGLDDVAEKCTFFQNDACNLDPLKFGKFDVVVAANLMEKLYAPKEFLRSVEQFVEPGGLLVIASTYNWNEEVTPSENWVGGFKHSGSGENLSTLDGLTEILTKDGKFRFVGTQCEIPEVKRSTVRSLSYDLSEVTVWEKTA